jgi:signal transduction histidine kinase
MAACEKQESVCMPSSEPNDGIGLVGMQERLKLVGGSLEIVTAPGKGTQLVAHVPLKEAE